MRKLFFMFLLLIVFTRQGVCFDDKNYLRACSQGVFSGKEYKERYALKQSKDVFNVFVLITPT